MRVLVVEDDDVPGRSLVELLTPLCDEVHAVSTLAGARARLEARRYAVLVLDLCLPDGDGLTLVEELARSGALAHRGIVLTTEGNVDAGTLGRAVALGCADVMTRPLHPELLKAKVQLLLELQRQRAELAERERLLVDALQRLTHMNGRRESRRMAVVTSAPQGPEAARELAQAAVETLRRSEERYRLAARASESVLWDWEVGAESIFWSESLVAVMGHRLPVNDGLCETTVAWRMEQVHPEDRARVDRSLTECLRGRDDTWSAEYRFRLGNGEWAHVLDRSCVVRDASGAAVRLVGALHDVTALREQEAEARSRMEFQQQLIGIVSHDLRNPISAISLGATVMLQRGDLTHAQAITMQQIVRAAERATRMVRDLLDFTRARLGGGIAIQPRAVVLNLLAEQVVRETLTANPTRKIELVSSGELHGFWDTDRLAQVLTNLLGNALAYSPEDSPVRVEIGEDGPDMVTLSVHNGGDPIPPHILPHIFEPMTRGAGGSSSGNSRSIGLGLYIVQNIARAHGGQVEVTSTAAEGTRFTVRLPRRPPSAAQRGSGVFSLRALRAAQEARRARGG